MFIIKYAKIQYLKKGDLAIHWLHDQQFLDQNYSIPPQVAVWDVNVTYAGLINTFLKDAPYLVVDLVEIRAIEGAKEWVK